MKHRVQLSKVYERLKEIAASCHPYKILGKPFTIVDTKSGEIISEENEWYKVKERMPSKSKEDDEISEVVEVLSPTGVHKGQYVYQYHLCLLDNSAKCMGGAVRWKHIQNEKNKKNN